MLQSRLETVAKALPLAADYSQYDVEYVHALRVATRRASAAMKLFEGGLPQRRGAWFIRKLKRIRQIAGSARDHDVLLLRLEKLAEQYPQADWTPLLDHLLEQRAADQPAIEKIRRRLKSRWPVRLGKLLKKVHVPTEQPLPDRPTYGNAAGVLLSPAVRQFCSHHPQPSDSDEMLHALRIDLKQLRYSMEIFAGAFPTPFRQDIYPQVVFLQELLGELNDSVVGRNQFESFLTTAQSPELRDTLTQLMAHETTRISTTRQQFFTHWTPAQQQSLQTAFCEFLPTHHCPQ